MNWVIAALGVLAIGACAPVLLAPYRAWSFRLGLGAGMIASLCCVAAALSRLSGAAAGDVLVSWPLPLGSASFELDGLSAWFLLLTGVAGCATTLYSPGYFEGGRTAKRAYAPLLCVLLAALVLVECAADIVVFLAGWELMSLSAFLLVGLPDTDAETRRGAWMYLIATHLGTALGVLPLLGAFVARSGGTEMAGFSGSFDAAGSGICATLFVLGLIGFGTKAGFMPMHVWLPAAHPVAPSPVSALMSGVVIKTGIYGLLRLITWLPELPVVCAVLLIVVSLVSAVAGILQALGQRQIKRMLAFSSVENIGIIGLGIGLALLGRAFDLPGLTALGFAGALLHVLNHAFIKALLFLCAGSVLHATGTGNIERLGGLSRPLRLTSICFLGGAAAISALPPLNGFLGEFLIYRALLEGAQALTPGPALMLAGAAALLALTGAITLAAFAKVFSIVFLGEARDHSVSVHTPHWTMSAAPLLLLAACTSIVLLPGPLAGALHEATAALHATDTSAGPELPATFGGLLKPFALLLVLGGGLYLLRSLLHRAPSAAARPGTWGCGFPAPRPSMQYTGTSFGWKLLASFRQVVPARRSTPRFPGIFAAATRCESSQYDPVLMRVYVPVFQSIARKCELLWPLQHGRVQLYLVYIVVTVLIVFLVEAWQHPPVSERQARPAVAETQR